MTEVHVVAQVLAEGVLVEPRRHRSPSTAHSCKHLEQTQYTVHLVHADMVCIHTFPQVQGQAAKVVKVAAKVALAVARVALEVAKVAMAVAAAEECSCSPRIGDN
jgi:hypothetical protein